MSDKTETPEEESRRFTRRMGAWLKKVAVRQKDEDLHDALAELVEDQADDTKAAEPEYQLLHNILKLRERTVADCMCPRADIVAVSADMDFSALTQFVTKEAHSRYPVYRDNLDDVIGIIILKDIMAAMARSEAPATDTLMRDVLFVPATMPVMKLLLQMREKHHHLAIVVDEYGGVDGLVTIEDLVEQIVGEIEDEHDEAGYTPPTMKADGSLMIDARMPLQDLEKSLGNFLTDDERNAFDTVNGLILSLAGRLPPRGTKVAHSSGVHFEITDADTSRVKRLRVSRGTATVTNLKAAQKA